jgi:hypothetical protein
MSQRRRVHPEARLSRTGQSGPESDERLAPGAIGNLTGGCHGERGLVAVWSAAVVAAAIALGHAVAMGQQPAGTRPARAVAPVDLTGYWVSVVTEDWRWRMVTPRRGDYASVPLNAEGRRVADTWDLTRDEAGGHECRAFGVGGIMRQPGRLHITWDDDATLKIEFDAGTQTRYLHFDGTRHPGADRTWQGHSIAQWQGPAIGRVEAPPGPGAGPAGPPVPGGGGRGLRGAPPPRDQARLAQGGALRVTTTQFRAGYLRRNGVPYSESASITEYITRLPAHPNGDEWLHVVTIVEDPTYLTQPFYTSTHFKREADGSRWNPTPCRTDPPVPLDERD